MSEKVSAAMMEKWSATPFDETDRIEQVAERARRFLVNAALEKISELDTENGEEVSAMLAGFVVGYVNIAMSFVGRSDEVDKAFAEAIASHGEWAVDMVRVHEGKMPLRLATSPWRKMPEEPLDMVSILTIHEDRVCGAWQTEDDQWFTVAEAGVEAIYPEIYQPMPPMPTDEEMTVLSEGEKT